MSDGLTKHKLAEKLIERLGMPSKVEMKLTICFWEYYEHILEESHV